MSSAPGNDGFRDNASYRRSLRESSDYQPVQRSFIDEFDYDDDFTRSVFDDEPVEFDPFVEYGEEGEEGRVSGTGGYEGGAVEVTEEPQVEEEEEGELLQPSSAQLSSNSDVSEEVVPVAPYSETRETAADDDEFEAVSPSLLLIDRSQRNRARRRRRDRVRRKKERRDERERKRAELQKKLEECQSREQAASGPPGPSVGRNQVVPFGGRGPQWMHCVSFETTSQFLEVVDTLRFWFARVNETSGRRQLPTTGAPEDVSLLRDFEFPPRRDAAAAFAGQKLVVYGGYAGPNRTLKDTSLFFLRKLYGSLGVGGPIEQSLKLENEAWGTRARMSGRSKMVKLSEVSVGLIDGESSSVPVIVDLQQLTTLALRDKRHSSPKWKTVPIIEMRSAPPPREGFSAVAVNRKEGRKIYVFGGSLVGSRSGKKETNSLYELRPARRTPNGELVKTSRWSQVVEVFPIGVRPRPRWAYGVRMRRYDETETWSECFARKKIRRNGRVGPCARSGHACCASGNSFFIFGGSAGSNMLNDLWRWNGRWTELVFSSGVPPPPLSHSLLALPDSRNVLVYGGETKRGPSGGMFRFRLDTKRWTLVSPLQRPPQTGMTRFGSAMLSPTRYALIGGWISNEATSSAPVVGSGIVPPREPEQRRLSDEIIFLSGLSNGHSFELGAHLEKKRREGSLVDLHLVADNDRVLVQAHKCILAARSPTFRRLFAEQPCAQLAVLNVGGPALEAYISFLYCGDVKLSSLEEIEQFLDLGRRFGHEDLLRDVCRPGRPLTLETASIVVRQLRDDFFALFRDQSCFTDLEIVCQGEEDGGDLELFRCHRIFLTRSSFVNKALHSGMMEEVHGRLTFDTLSVNGLHQIIRYLYSDEVVGVDETTAVECHFFALLFKLPRVASVCRSVITEMLTEETVPEILALFAHTDAALRSACVRFLVENGYEAFSRSSAFDDLESSVKLKVIDQFMSAQKRQKKQSTRAKNRAYRELRHGRRWYGN